MSLVRLSQLLFTERGQSEKMDQLDIYVRQWEGGSMRSNKVHKIQEGKDVYLRR